MSEEQGLRFSCTGCGACCVGGGDYHVFVTAAEAEAVRAHLGVSAAWFRRRYLRRLPDGERVLAAGAAGRCVFLGADNACRVYPARPVQCRTYPFWPEIIGVPGAWAAEARRCEGIGRGAVVGTARVRAALRRHRAAGD